MKKILRIIATKGLGNLTIVEKKSFKKVCASYHQHDIVLQDGSGFLDESYLKKTHFGSMTGTERKNIKYDGCSTNTR